VKHLGLELLVLWEKHLGLELLVLWEKLLGLKLLVLWGRVKLLGVELLVLWEHVTRREASQNEGIRKVPPPALSQIQEVYDRRFLVPVFLLVLLLGQFEKERFVRECEERTEHLGSRCAVGFQR
jgi:hypothetical protein